VTKQPVKRFERPWNVVIRSTLDSDVNEMHGLEQTQQGSTSEKAQVPNDLCTRTTVDSTQTHLGEEGLNTNGEQYPVVPRGQSGARAA